MLRIKLTNQSEIAQKANNIKYKFDKKERKSGLFFILTNRIKAVLLIFKL